MERPSWPQVKSKRPEIDRVQLNCPTLSGQVNGKSFWEVNGARAQHHRVAFCCQALVLDWLVHLARFPSPYGPFLLRPSSKRASLRVEFPSFIYYIFLSLGHTQRCSETSPNLVIGTQALGTEIKHDLHAKAQKISALLSLWAKAVIERVGHLPCL